MASPLCHRSGVPAFLGGAGGFLLAVVIALQDFSASCALPASGLVSVWPAGAIVVSRPSHKQGTDPQRVLAVQGPVIFQGQTGTALVTLEAQGDENAVGFSLAFDPTVAKYTGATNSADATGATMDVNANQATNGQVGIILALPTGSSFSPGTRQVVQVNFQAVTASTVNSTLALTDVPVRREVSDTNALPVVATYSNGTISANPKPSLTITHSNQAINLVWPLWATNYYLQQAIGTTPPVGTWTNLTISPVLTNGNAAVTLPVSGSVQFYRLKHQ